MVLLLFNMCLQSSNWQISSRRLRLTLIISFTSPNSVLLIHYEFKGGIRYVLTFSIIVFLQGVLYIFSPSCTCIYSGPGPQMNTSDIHNNILNLLGPTNLCSIFMLQYFSFISSSISFSLMWYHVYLPLQMDICPPATNIPITGHVKFGRCRKCFIL
jgi:hypothetical protein